jgi:hypothetical protein
VILKAEAIIEQTIWDKRAMKQKRQPPGLLHITGFHPNPHEELKN